jgi:precorrin-2 dehydrogenase/sirohydrochlorin ferrochelatase
MKSMFPAFLKLDGRALLVVGAGEVGEQKIEGLLSTGARITVVALQANEKVQEWARVGRLALHQRAFQAADLDGMFLAVVATSSRDLNEFVYREAQRQRVLCNVVDVPEQCDFFYPAIVRRGDLQIAISTSGQSPSLAQRIRKQLEQQFGPNYAQWVEELGRTRRLVLASDLPAEIKQELLHSLASREAFEEQLRAASRELRASGELVNRRANFADRNSNMGDDESADTTSSGLQIGQHVLVARSSQLVARSSEETA